MSSKFSDLLLMLNIVRLSYEKQYILCENLSIQSIEELEETLFNLPFDQKTIQKLNQRMKKIDLEKYKESLQINQIKFLCYEDERYSKNLRHTQYPPPLLYYKGNLETFYNEGIAVVGSRKNTDYGKYVCEKLVEGLSHYKIPIISGLALGIDSIAHRTALKNGSPTLGVLGNSLEQIYPKRNRELYKKMEEYGCILSEFPLGSDPKPYNFPQRNRIISGVGLGVLVIEAEKKSGTLLTATAAGEQGREVFSVPGNIFSKGSEGANKLIQDGAKLVMNVEDIINELPQWQSLIKADVDEEKIKKLTRRENSIYQSLLISPKNCDEICFEKNMTISEVLEIITLLELKGLIGMIGDKYTIIN